MTRWARSKTVLKHERQPGEATTWSEFVAQRQQAAKPSSVRHDGSKASLRVLNTEERQPKTSNLAAKRKPASLGNFVSELSTDHGDHGGAAGDVFDSKKTTTASSSKPSQRVIRNGSNLKAKCKNPTKRKEVEVHDEEAEALEKLLLKHKKIEADIPVVQKAVEVASKELHAVAAVPSSSTANARDHKFQKANARKTAKKGLVSLKKKACLPKTNISASETAAPASRNTQPTSSVTKKCSAEKESPSSAEVSKVRKRKVVSEKPPPPSFRENNPFPAQDGANLASSNSKKLGKVRKRKAQGKKAEAMVVNEKVLPVDKNENMSNSDGEEEQPASKVPRTGGNSKAKWLQQMRQEREAKGLLLLPEKVERRIYLAKKAMRKKGLPGEQIKEAVRKMRRKEELLFRRQLAKLCFKCRQPGHRVSDCPQMLEDSSEPIGICFKCGSTEHFSSACTVQTSKDNEFPYAKCFICKQQGHLSRKCPRNDKGVYPKGGHCNFCGAVDHFKKECPEMEKNKNKTSDESEVAADIVSIGQSADAENIVPLHKGIQVKKKKVISF